MEHPKIVIEVHFSKEIQKDVLEEMVMTISEGKSRLIGELAEIDPKVAVRVWYERGRMSESVKLPSIMRIFASKKKERG